MDTILEMESYNADKKSREKKTLYSELLAIDFMKDKLTDLDSSVKINVDELQGKIIKNYLINDNNPVLLDAVNGKISVEDSLNELAQIYIGIKKFLPHKKNDGHNQRVKDIGELISEPSTLKTYGLFSLDNVISGGLTAVALTFGTTYLFAEMLLPEMYVNTDPEFLEQQYHMFTVQMPIILSTIIAPILGIGLNSYRFNPKLPIYEAKYVDDKITIFRYANNINV